MACTARIIGAMKTWSYITYAWESSIAILPSGHPITRNPRGLPEGIRWCAAGLGKSIGREHVLGRVLVKHGTARNGHY